MNINEIMKKLVKKKNGCIEWIGRYNGWGYGSVWFNGKETVVHEVMWERKHGPVPKGLLLDHIVCDNPRCANNEHVKPVTCKANVLRGKGITAMKARQTECIRGHSLSGDNLYVKPDGHRACKICKRERQIEYRKTHNSNNYVRPWECE